MKKILLSLLFLIPLFNYGQFTESFEGATTLPVGWTVINGGDAAQTWVVADLTGSELTAQDGTNIACIGYGSTAHNDFLITPSFVVTAGVSDQLSFWGRSRDPDYPEVIAVKLSNTTNTAAAFTYVLAATIAPESGADFYKYTLPLTGHVGETVYIGFQSTTTDKFYFDIDEVKIGTASSCVEPTALVVTDLTSTSATVSWTAPASAPAEGYDYYVSTTNSTASAVPTGSVGPGVLTTPVTLTSGMLNYVWVRSKCGAASTSEWSAKATIDAPLPPATTPYSYGFESNDGWSILNAGSGNNWGITAPTGDPEADPILEAAEGAAYASYDYSTFEDANAWLFSRAISMTAGQTYHVDFKYRVASATTPFPENLKVTIGTANTVESQTFTAFDMAGITAQEWTAAVTTDFLAPATGTYVIGFNCYSAADQWQLGVDDVVVTALPLSTDKFSESAFEIFPNPVSNVLNITNTTGALINSINIVDLNGRTVKAMKLNGLSNSQINVSDLSSGMYMMTINSDKGSVTKKIVKN